MEEKQIFIKFRKIAIQRWGENTFAIVLRDSEDNDVYVIEEHTSLPVGEEYRIDFGYEGVIAAMVIE